MKTLILLLLTVSGYSFADCKTSQSEKASESKEEARVEQPKGLKGAVITIRLPDGKEYQFKSEDYMVAKRIKTTKIKLVEKENSVRCERSEKNEIALGARNDFQGLETSASGSTAIVRSKKGTVLDATYTRHNVIGPVNLGVGVDTNGTPKGVIGIDF